MFLVLGWLPLVVALWRRRDRLRQKCGSVLGVFAIFFLCRGSGLVVASVLSDFEGWWMMGAVILVGVQLLLVRMAADRGNREQLWVH